VALLLLLSACATPPDPAVERLLAVLDRDGDGVLDAAELDAQASPTLDWHAWDRDKDERIGPHELAAILVDVNPILTWRRTPDGPAPVAPTPTTTAARP
jgi:hypothetical protein